jgi:pimeloyl-ACP methyl ester carboxylesterase
MERTFRRDPVRRDAYTAEDIQQYKQALSRPGALTAMVNYYRAMIRYRLDSFPMVPVEMPTLVLWGEGDRYLDVGMTHGLKRWAPSVRVERIASSSHWVPCDAPQRVNELLIEFLRS